ncbi:prepilin-type N-terminal cleavage/methylation domain-containing protein [Limnobacter sp.]|uniref:prepilin-type N-terminal cleavage/methylation domain-containing protein n=1 Tax=Limnobacter sp. TaxID=2003368 RepID=UPI002590E318|nr:prepilin-type N-terminal cleavage/methylation domain-containing protein [Limnobacter sp.]
MPTLAPGNSKKPGVSAYGPNGFSLLEILVVLVVMSIAAGLITIRGTPGDSRYLQAEGQKLSQILRIAQQQALLKSQEIRFVAGSQGYSFEEFNGLTWQPVTEEPMLRTRVWDNGPIKATLLNQGQAVRFLIISPTPGLITNSVVLQKNNSIMALTSQTSGQFVLGPVQKAVQNRSGA